MSAYAIPVEKIRRLKPYMNDKELSLVLQLIEEIRAETPPPSPVSDIDKIVMETSLAAFFKAAWKVIEPGRPLAWSWHYDYICEHLQLVIQKKLRRLKINVPPRTAKSSLATISFPCWAWLQNPSLSFLCASYSNSLSTDHSVGRRNLISSNFFQGLWADKFHLAPDRNLTTQFSNDKMGQMIATSTGSGAEGRGGDIAILDDPMSSEQSLSDTERTSANRWITNTLKQRLNDPATAAIILIMQRLHEMDTAGFVAIEDPGAWTEIVIPLVAEEDREFVYPISGKVHFRPKGDILQPDRFPPVIVEEKKRNRLVFAGQYQQRPAPVEGNMIKRSDVRYYGGFHPVTREPDELLNPDRLASERPRFDRCVISVDCSFKDLKTSDYVAIGVIGVRQRKRFVLNIVNAHLDVDGTVKEIKNQKQMYPQVTAVLVEDKANGPAVVNALKRDVSGVIEIEPEGGKVSRVFAVAPEWQAGDWYVDRNAMWAEPFVQQITMFPTAAHDDMVDMMSQAGIYLSANSLGAWQGLCG